MRQVKTVLAAAACACLCAALLLCGGCAYRPAEGEIYYRMGSVYRTIERVGEAQHRELLPVEVLWQPDGSEIIRLEISESYPRGALFFENPYIADRAGAEVIRDELGIPADAAPMQDTLATLRGTGLYTFTQREYRGMAVSYQLRAEEVPPGEVLGSYGKADVYTFRYQDRSAVDGHVTAAGEFRVFVVRDMMIGSFALSAKRG